MLTKWPRAKRLLLSTAITSAVAALAGLLPATPAQAHVFGPFLIQNTTTGMCADVPGFGNGTLNGPVNQYWCDGTYADNQRWYVETRSSVGATALFWIRNVKDGLCMDVANTGWVPAGSLVSEFYCLDDDNQYFWLSSRPDGHDWFVNYKSNLCLDVSGVGGSGGANARLTLFPCSDSDDHHWTIVPVG